MYPSKGCSFVDWYYGEGGLATTLGQAASLEPQRHGIEGITDT